MNPEENPTIQFTESNSMPMLLPQDDLLNNNTAPMYDMMTMTPTLDNHLFPMAPEMMVFNSTPNYPMLSMTSYSHLLPMSEPFSAEFYEYKANDKPKENTKKKPKEEPMDEQSKLDSAELRRKIHIQSEQKRRAQIKDGFEELRKQLPNCANKQLSKAAILNKTCLHLQHLKASHFVLLNEIERLRLENEGLRQFQMANPFFQNKAVNGVYSLNL